MCIPAVSAFTLSGISIDPSGSLTPGTPVTVFLTVQFPTSAGRTFPPGDDLHFSTGLASPQWSYSIILNEIDNARSSGTSRSLDVSGFQLSYPSKVSESLRLSLQGTVPSVDKTSNITIISVQENYRNGNVVTGSVFARTAMIINVKEVPAAIADMRNNLVTFRSDIDEKAAMGINTTAAEAKYREGSRVVDGAAALSSGQFYAALDALHTAQKLIDDGETELDLAWANEEVAAAHLPITNTDALVGWFKGNATTADDPQLSSIIAIREVAASYHSRASDLVASGEYSLARDKAKDAFTKGNESYTNALQRQQSLTQGVNHFAGISGIVKSGVPVIVVGVICVAVVGAGIVIWRKRSRWDELG
jgi:hypothetical protein